ncbi:MAG: NUDIX domain-containing protein, partial [Parachlamydia sp.]|nr:NUDIX domain-containing protein [Parachlamydia sp.]
TIQALAQAPLDDVIKMWEGLGYYSRARNLHEGARMVVEQFEGRLPADAASLARIKGLGDYTIGAILSFAFHQRVPAVDGNVVRVLARYLCLKEDIAKPSTIRMIRQKLADLLPEEESWIINEALIELGATVCQRKPMCRECPIRKSCSGYAAGIADQLPVKSTRTRIEALYRIVAVLQCGEHLLVKRVGKGEIMSGLHEFPYFETVPDGLPAEDVCKEIRNRFGVRGKPVAMPKVSHSFTRYRVQLFPFHMHCGEMPEISGYQWLTVEQINQVAFSSGHRRVRQLIIGA